LHLDAPLRTDDSSADAAGDIDLMRSEGTDAVSLALRSPPENRKCCACSRIFLDLKAPEKRRFDRQQLI